VKEEEKREKLSFFVKAVNIFAICCKTKIIDQLLPCKQMTNKRKPLNFLIGRSFFMQKSDVAD
jgi:hypothetical protein